MQVISLGDYRRKMIGGAQKLPADYFVLGEEHRPLMAMIQCPQPKFRREITRNAGTQEEMSRRMRAIDLGLLQQRRAGGYLRCEQRYTGATPTCGGEVRSGWDTCCVSWYVAVAY